MELEELEIKIGQTLTLKDIARYEAHKELGAALAALHDILGFPKGVNPMCGWEWIVGHKNDLTGWGPTIELLLDGKSQLRLSGNLKQMREATRIFAKRARYAPDTKKKREQKGENK